MAATRIKLDSAGIQAMLRSAEVAAAIHAVAENVADNVRADPNILRRGIEGEVSVDDYVTDRAATSVTITHPAGLGMEGKHGVLTKAARAAGLEVKAKKA
ncbi:hypothetical protein OG474_09635 [Kribbella sp. NBC_01505]|uniref:hypothetical protein n=1 Tax=Kribbella sp. NBC_01505 TaxID=2903580 RepID=UPI003864606D